MAGHNIAGLARWSPLAPPSSRACASPSSTPCRETVHDVTASISQRQFLVCWCQF